MTSLDGIDSRFEASDGVVLHARTWTPIASEPKAGIVIVHGLGEHIGRYDRIARAMNARGYAVQGCDHRWHGRSPGKMGRIASFDAFVSDLAEFVDHVAHGEPARPLFLMGHSLGGLILGHYVTRHETPAQGLIFSGSALALDDSVSPALLALSPWLARLAPWLPVQRIDPAGISRIEEEVRAYRDDPLVFHGKLTARTAHELTQAIAKIQPRLEKIVLPFIALHGEADPIVPLHASQLLCDRAASEDKTLKTYPGAYHEVFNDLPREEFMKDILDWLDARC